MVEAVNERQLYDIPRLILLGGSWLEKCLFPMSFPITLLISTPRGSKKL
jgi:hypothetical protein